MSTPQPAPDILAEAAKERYDVALIPISVNPVDYLARLGVKLKPNGAGDMIYMGMLVEQRHWVESPYIYTINTACKSMMRFDVDTKKSTKISFAGV